MKKFQIVSLTTLAACAYGVIHDQITARICIEYFTIAHPHLFPTGSVTLLALCWGVAATAGLGVLWGIVLALVSQSGAKSMWPIARLSKWIVGLISIMAVGATAAGLAGYELSRVNILSVPDELSAAISSHQHDRFMAVWFAHAASYLLGLSGSALICLAIWQARGRPPVLTLLPKTRAAGIRAALLALAAVYAIWLRFLGH